MSYYKETCFIGPTQQQVQPPPPPMYSPQQFNKTAFDTKYDATALSYPAQIGTGAQTPQQQLTSQSNATPGYPNGPQLQTYSSFPQIGGTGAVQTPISLPGMPPITVSTTIPPQQLEAMHLHPMVSHHN